MQKIQQLYSIVAMDPLAANHMQNEMRFSIMMKDVYEILGEAIGQGGWNIKLYIRLEIIMVYASDFRKGKTFIVNGDPCVVLDFQHVKPGKGAAFVRTKYRNILTGATREEAFNPSDKFEDAIIETRKMQYLYNDGELYYFMDPETYDQVPLAEEQVEDAIKWIRENDEVTIKFFQGNAFQVEAENFVNLVVIDCEPGVKGNTATNVTKAATVETGATVQVPIFIEQGEKIQIDTRTGEYLGRAKND